MKLTNEREILRIVARELAKEITNKTIADLQEIKETLSGEDSGLENAWEEICVQVQKEYSHFWDTYDDMARDFVRHNINKLEEHKQAALWFFSEGWYTWNHDTDEEPPILIDETVENITQEYLYYEAGRWENDRISAYLYGNDDDYDEDEDY